MIWQIPREEKTNYSTPFVWENPQRTELVISGINWVTSYDLDGKELWKIKGKSILAIPTPFEQFGLLYVTSGHVLWGENRIYAIRPGAKAISRRSEGNPTSPIASPGTKRSARITPRRSSSMITCICSSIAAFWRASTPRRARSSTTRSGIPTAKRSPAPPGATRGKLFCLNEDGVTFAIQPGPEVQGAVHESLAEDDMCMATPVIVGDKLLIRSAKRLYCIQN